MARPRSRGQTGHPAILIRPASSRCARRMSIIPWADIPNAPQQDKLRQDVTTDLQFTGGQVLVAGLSNEEFASQLHIIPFPFAAVDKGTTTSKSINGSHQQIRNQGAGPCVRHFRYRRSAERAGSLHLHAAGEISRGRVEARARRSRERRIAELGNHNRPLDMVVYNKDGKDWILMSNHARGLIKVDLANVDKSEGVTERIPDRPAWGTRRSRSTRRSTSSIASTRTMRCYSCE